MPKTRPAYPAELRRQIAPAGEAGHVADRRHKRDRVECADARDRGQPTSVSLMGACSANSASSAAMRRSRSASVRTHRPRGYACAV